MTALFAALAVLGWAAAIASALLWRGGGSVRTDVDGEPYFDTGSPRGRIIFWLSVLGPTVGLVATLLVLA